MRTRKDIRTCIKVSELQILHKRKLSNKASHDPHSTEKICAYASGKFNPIKSTIDAEIHACINSLEAFKIFYLDKQCLTLRTDCQAIISSLSEKSYLTNYGPKCLEILVKE